MTAIQLAIALIMIVASTAIGAYSVGLLIGRGKAETEVMRLCQRYPWLRARNVARELYPDRVKLNVNPKNKKNHEEA